MAEFKSYKFVVYTCVVGNYSNLKPSPHSLRTKYSFLCFSDSYFECEGWDVIQMNLNSTETPRRIAKRPKIHPWDYFQAQASVWIDANMEIIPEIFDRIFNEFILSNKPIGIFPHNKRQNLEQEFNDIEFFQKDDPIKLKTQRECYQAEMNLAECDLFQGGILFRIHENVLGQKFMNNWQAEIDKFSARDQLSLAKIVYVNDPSIIHIFRIFTTDTVIINPHNKYTTEHQNKNIYDAIRWKLIALKYKMSTNRTLKYIRHIIGI